RRRAPAERSSDAVISRPPFPRRLGQNLRPIKQPGTLRGAGAASTRFQANRSSTIIASMDSMAHDWVPDTAFGRWFLSTDMWLQRVLARAIADLKQLAGTNAPDSF